MKTRNLADQVGLDISQLREICLKEQSNIYDYYLPNIPSAELREAMAYALNNVGKCLRPLLIYATGMIFNAPTEAMRIPAASVEIIHTYSLIHDDLPCMDNADLRRNQPTCHKVYGDGMAVLTGDALHTLSIQILASFPGELSMAKRLKMLHVLSKACGPYGMAAGQALDISLMTNTGISKDLLIDIYRLKTGALFSACISLGYLSSDDDDEKNEISLNRFGDCIGLAFQIQDDILDIESSSDVLGKPQLIDHTNNKMTYPILFGLEEAKNKVQSLYEDALQVINYLGSRANLLRELTEKMLIRIS